MVNFCCILNCSSRRGARETKALKFFRIPTVCKNKTKQGQNLSQRRRMEWLRYIHPKTITNTSTKPWHRVCSKHFLTGQPAAFADFNHPDWIPTLELGHNLGQKTKRELYQRVKQRTTKKEQSQQSAKEIGDIQSSSSLPFEVEDICSVGTQAELTFKEISQLEDVVNQFTAENKTLRESVAEREMYNEVFFQSKADRVKYYTGLPNFTILMGVVELIGKNLKDGAKSSLSKFRQTVLTLMRLRLNLPVYLLADMFGISQGAVSKIFYRVLDVMYVQCQLILRWPDREQIRKTVPPAFREQFGRRVTVLID